VPDSANQSGLYALALPRLQPADNGGQPDNCRQCN
jgi:hypothetical protein